MKTNLVIALVIFFHITAAKENTGSLKSAKPNAAKTAANCPNTTAQYDLDINNVRARILNGGDLWWDPVGQSNYYEVPTGSNKNSIYSGAIWIAGLDGGGQIKAAAQTYRQTGANDFWAGPISNLSGTMDVTNATCSAYDRFWAVTKQEVQTFASTGVATPTITSWPGNGNLAAGELLYMAPFYDANADGIYNTADGDYPNYILSGSPPPSCNGFLQGDKTVWWVFNDIGNAHTETFSQTPIGLEIRAQAFAFISNDSAINNATFYEYQIINRSNLDLDDTYFGIWCDADLGNAVDDYVGCNVSLGLGYCYNGDSNDDGASGYGLNPPAVGIDFLQGPLADAGDGIDNDRDSIIDEPDEQIIMSKFLYYTNANGTPNGNPAALDDYYQYLTGTWTDGTMMTYGGNGLNQSNPLCNFMFPDLTDPAFPGQQWTMASAAISPDDMRFLQSAGPFTLSAGEVNYVTTGVVWAKASSGGPSASVNLLFAADVTAQSLFDNCFVVSVNEKEASSGYNIYPQPCTETSTLTFKNTAGTEYTFRIYNSTGKLVKEMNDINSGTIQFSREGLLSGIYIFSLSSGKEIKHTGKITVL